MNAFLYYIKPKNAVTELLGRPALQHQIDNLKRFGINSIGVSCLKDAPEANQIEKICSENQGVQFVPAPSKPGTGGFLFLAGGLFPEGFFYIDGDRFFLFDAKRMYDFHQEKDDAITVMLRPEPPSKEPTFIVADEGHVVAIDLENVGISMSPLTFSGIVYIGPLLAESFEPDSFFEMDLMTEAIHPTFAAGNCVGYKSSEYVMPISRNIAIENDLRKGLVEARCLANKQKAIFLDRDGVLNEFGDFVTKPEMLKMKKEAAEAVRLINQSGYLAIVITNQPIVARGQTDIHTLLQIHGRLHFLLGINGAVLDDLYFCPHFPVAEGEHPNMKYVQQCSCRKPGIGLFLQAAARYNIDLSKSWMIGDTTQDVQAGINAGCHTALVLSGDPNPRKKCPDAKPDIECQTLLEALKPILG